MQVTTFLMPSAAIACPVASPTWVLVKEVRKMFLAHRLRVSWVAPAFGMMVGMPSSRAILLMASATPECTVPMSTSAFSPCTSLVASAVAFGGSDSSSTLTKLIARPASEPPFCFT